MARITGSADEKVFQIQRWLGLNENPDGDTKLKMGEAAEMRNFRVTRDGNLQKRPGCRARITLEAGKPIDAIWTDGFSTVLAICNNKLFSCGETSTVLHTFSSTENPHMFAFGGCVYILNGGASAGYYVYDGNSVSAVTPYIPLVAVAVPPAGGGDLLEQVNKLTAKRRVWLSPDGNATTFQLPEKGLDSIDSAKLTADGSTVTISSSDTTNGTVTFSSAPAAGTSTIEVIYTAKTDDSETVYGMHFSETYNGSQDTRVFLYGDGSNTAIYSDINYDGQPDATYFPDLNVVRVGVSNTAITGMIRHYGSLAVFKTDGAYSIGYGTVTLANGNETAGFYVSPVNATIGLEAPGQVALVLNSPVTIFGKDVYEWKNSSYYTSNLTRDERQAKRISDRIYATLHSFDTKTCLVFDDNYNQEYYICNKDGRALVWNYAADAWYLYTDFPMYKPFSVVTSPSGKTELWFGGKDGRLYHVSDSYSYDTDSTDPTKLNKIDCYWESGSMSFGRDYQRKSSAMLWMGFRPDAKAELDVTVLTDKEAIYPTKSLSHQLFDFEHIDFDDFTFSTSDKPQMRRLKIKAKKFVYYKLILMTNTNNSSVTVTAADIRVRYMGYHK